MDKFISVCMIVKNEEKVIDRCLSSVAHLVDEVIIVDTGSTDLTKKKAQKYTSKLYDFEWINDFSAARNYAASKATGKWILVLDADEYVDEENFKEFINELKQSNEDTDGYTAKILNFTGNFGENLVQNHHDRIYRNNGGVIYQRKIHEQFYKVNGESLIVKNSSLLVFHSGYLSQTVSEKGKNQRNKELLDCEMNKGSNKPFDYFNIGNEYASIGEYSKALDSYLNAYKLKSDIRLSWVSTTLVQIVICLLNLNRYNDALNVIKEAESLYNNAPEFPYFRGEVLFHKRQFDDAKFAFEQLLNNTHIYNHILLRPDFKDQLPHRRLAEIYLYEKNYQKAIYHYISVLNINRYCEESIEKVIYILTKFHTIKEISDFLKSKDLINNNNIKNYVRACFKVVNLHLAIHLLKGYEKDNKLLVELTNLKLLCIYNEGEVKELVDILNPDLLVKLRSMGWINNIDLYLLLKNVFNVELPVSLSMLEEDHDLINIEKLINGELKETIDSHFYVNTLQILLNYKRYSLCNLILSLTDWVSEQELPRVARLLYLNEFKAEALRIYDKGNWNYFDSQDLINIIESLEETNHVLKAIEIARYALLTYKEDFRFYKFIFEKTTDSETFQITLNQAKDIFNESLYMEKYIV